MKIVNVMAASIDGRIGLHDREGDTERQSLGLSGLADQRLLRQQIESADAIIVGASSIRANHECLDHPGADGMVPTWFVFAQGPLPASFHFWRQFHIRRFLVSKKPLPIEKESGVQNIVFGDEEPASFLVHYMQQAGFKSALLFGGGLINRWFYARQLVDELCLSLAPVILGESSAPFLVSPQLPKLVKFSLLTSQVEENFVFLRYRVCRLPVE